MRYNIFNKAHLPLKRSLLNACISFDKYKEEEISSGEVLQKAEEVLYIFNEQLTYESLHILPLIFEYEPSIWNNYTSEHNKAARIAKNLKELAKELQRQKRVEDKLKILELIIERFNEFILFNFNHMDDEEAVLNEILWRYYKDPVLVQIEERMDILPHLLKSSKRTEFQIASAA